MKKRKEEWPKRDLMSAAMKKKKDKVAKGEVEAVVAEPSSTAVEGRNNVFSGFYFGKGEDHVFIQNSAFN